jgi:hypothetical protein
LVRTRSARICFPARLADLVDKVGQGQRSTEGLSHASGDAPCRSSAKPPPLAGLPPTHGAFQEHAAHTIEWSMMLSSNDSLGTCIPKVLPHSSMPLHGAPSERCKPSPARACSALPPAPSLAAAMAPRMTAPPVWGCRPLLRPVVQQKSWHLLKVTPIPGDQHHVLHQRRGRNAEIATAHAQPHRP